MEPPFEIVTMSMLFHVEIITGRPQVLFVSVQVHFGLHCNSLDALTKSHQNWIAFEYVMI